MSDKQDFSEIGDRIKDAVQDAVNSGDFGQLNHVINDSVNGALDEVRWQVNQAHERVYKRTDKTVEYKSAKRSIASSYSTSQSPYRRQMEQKQRYTTAKQYQRPDGTIVYKNTINVPQIFVKKGKVSGVLLSVFGGIGLGTFGLTALIMAIIWAATSSASLGGMTILFGLMAAACGGVLKRGGGLCKRLGRAERYLKLAGEEMYIRISELSEKTGWTPKTLGRDIRTMIESSTSRVSRRAAQESPVWVEIVSDAVIGSLISAHAFCACRVCAKCARTQISFIHDNRILAERAFYYSFATRKRFEGSQRKNVSPA